MNGYLARVLNEVFRLHAFRLGVAFPNPDERAVTDIGRVYATFAFPGDAGDAASDPVRRIERRGGCDDASSGTTLEEFAFATGTVGGKGVNGEGTLWMERCCCIDADTVRGTDGGRCAYPAERTGSYDWSSLRAFVARVTAAAHRPPSSVDGSSLRAFVAPRVRGPRDGGGPSKKHVQSILSICNIKN